MQEKMMFGDKYSVTDGGKVYSFVKGYRHELSQVKTSKRGRYRAVRMTVDGRSKLCYVHRLVAEAFIQNPNGYPDINHIDGDPSNNRVDNLEWCTPKQNLEHAYRTGLVPSRNCYLCGKEHYSKEHTICKSCRNKLIAAIEAEATRINKARCGTEIICGIPGNLTDRQFEFLELRAQGYTYEEIAKMEGCTKQNVHQTISKFINNSLNC